MDLDTLKQQIAEYEARRNQHAVEEAVKRELAMVGNLGSAAANVASLIHQQQQNVMNAHNTQMGAQAQANIQHGGFGRSPDLHYEDQETERFMAAFKAKDLPTWEFVTATAQLLNSKVRAHYSPARSPHCTPRHEYIVWQLFNYNWMMDVQWVGDATGGSEEEWTAHFAKLADRISEARERGDKQWGDESPLNIGQAAHLTQLYASYQNQMGQQHASVAGNAQTGSLMGAGGSSSQAQTIRRVLGVGQ